MPSMRIGVYRRRYVSVSSTRPTDSCCCANPINLCWIVMLMIVLWFFTCSGDMNCMVTNPILAIYTISIVLFCTVGTCLSIIHYHKELNCAGQPPPKPSSSDPDYHIIHIHNFQNKQNNDVSRSDNNV